MSPTTPEEDHFGETYERCRSATGTPWNELPADVRAAQAAIVADMKANLAVSEPTVETAPAAAEPPTLWATAISPLGPIWHKLGPNGDDGLPAAVCGRVVDIITTSEPDPGGMRCCDCGDPLDRHSLTQVLRRACNLPPSLAREVTAAVLTINRKHRVEDVIAYRLSQAAYLQEALDAAIARAEAVEAERDKLRHAVDIAVPVLSRYYSTVVAPAVTAAYDQLVAAGLIDPAQPQQQPPLYDTASTAYARLIATQQTDAGTDRWTAGCSGCPWVSEGERDAVEQAAYDHAKSVHTRAAEDTHA